MFNEQTAGALLHPTSLPGPDGIGDLGNDAFDFADWLADAGQRWWQVLPLVPTSEARNQNNCPYCSDFVFDRSPWLISLGKLAQQGLLSGSSFDSRPNFPVHYVDFGSVMRWKQPLLNMAADDFLRNRHDPDGYAEFCRTHTFLDDSALFATLSAENDHRAWPTWEAVDLRDRDGTAIHRARDRLQKPIESYKVIQYLFWLQWQALRRHCKGLGIRLIGDVPIYVADNSVSTWSDRHLFRLDASGRPTEVSGVPGDYFNPDGQFWGNPLYDWAMMAADEYAWWIQRARNELEFTDVIRFDHFRGLEAYWVIKAGAKSALEGSWAKGPGRNFLTKLYAALGGGTVPIIAEDLGVIDDGVRRLVKWSGLPCMRVIQFGPNEDGDDANTHLVHNHPENAVVYTGTHDNDTAVGWYGSCGDPVRHHARVSFATDGTDINWTLIRLAYSSCAHTAVVPVQDYLGLGSDARMNKPGVAAGNWGWRLTPKALNSGLARKVRALAAEHGRAVA